MCAIGEGPETKALLDFARPLIALYVGGMGARGKNFYNDLFCDYGFEKEAKEIQDLYLDGKKQDAEALVPMEFLEAMNLVGPESYVQGADRGLQGVGRHQPDASSRSATTRRPRCVPAQGLGELTSYFSALTSSLMLRPTSNSLSSAA